MTCPRCSHKIDVPNGNCVFCDYTPEDITLDNKLSTEHMEHCSGCALCEYQE